MEKEYICNTEEETRALAIKIADILSPRDIISLKGNLGVGKSFFVRSVIQSFLGEENIPSPTFTLVEVYETEIGSIWHFDLYRLKQAQEIYDLGIEEAFIEGISFIEWAENAQGYLPRNINEIELEIISETARKIKITGNIVEKLHG